MNIVILGPKDVERIADLERRSFIPELQATAEVMRQRFELGHEMFGLEEDGQLVGLQAIAYTRFSPDDFDSFPKTEQDFGLQPTATNYNAIFLYNFEIAPGSRGKLRSAVLFDHIIAYARAKGCQYIVGSGRVPSYAGSDPRHSQESFAQSPEVRQAIDRYFTTGIYPDSEVLLRDPLLGLYHRLGRDLGFTFHWVMRDFAPYDQASGGLRVIIYGRL